LRESVLEDPDVKDQAEQTAGERDSGKLIAEIPTIPAPVDVIWRSYQEPITEMAHRHVYKHVAMKARRGTSKIDRGNERPNGRLHHEMQRNQARQKPQPDYPHAF